MEKLIYALWRPEDTSAEAFNAALRRSVAVALMPLTRHLRLNLRDADVAGGTSPCFAVMNPSPDAVVQLWVDTAYQPRRIGIDAALAAVSSRVQSWLVCESNPIPNTLNVPAPGARTPGFSQIAFLLANPGMTHDAWRATWQDLHTQPAIDLQSTFEYVQNLVVRPVLPGPVEVWAIVEECFPLAALTDRTVYFDRPGDVGATDVNEAAMLRSVARFIGANGCDVFPTSQYELGRSTLPLD
jgi:hypothetical protein